MKAIVWTKYGSPDGLQLQELQTPAPKSDEILIKVHAATVTAGDCEMRRLQLPLGLSLPIRLYAGLFHPKRIPVLGQEFAGEVVAVGDQVTNYHIGDQIFGTTGFHFGTYAEYLCFRAVPGSAMGVLAPKPANISWEQAAACSIAGLEALHFLRAVNITADKKVLLIGGGGSIGTFAIQLAKHFGAQVTAIDSTEKLETMRALGADQVIDYTTEDYLSLDERYDLIIDVVGKHAVSRRLKLLKPDGIYHLAFARPIHLFLRMWTKLRSKKQLRLDASDQSQQDLLTLKELLETGKITTVIDRTFPLENTAEAHRYVESGAKTGSVAIQIVPTDNRSQE